jgi:biopolymer transport protein ExbD
MKPTLPDQSDATFDMTPMIDIVFLLIAFFMTVASMVSSESVEITLPLAEESVVPEMARNRQYITVTRKGHIYLGAKKVNDARDIIPTVQYKNSKIKGFEVFLRADSQADHRYVRDVMSAVAEAGVYNVIFANRKG